MASLKDIADASGVSIRTVGRVLKGSGYVGQATKERVERTVQRLGYRPNRIARSLRTGSGFVVHAILGAVDELHIAKLAAFQAHMSKHGYGVNVLFASSPIDNVLDEIGERPAGLVILPGGELKTAALNAINSPKVYIDPTSKNSEPAVFIDRMQGVYDAVLLLAERNCRHIAYVGPNVSTRIDGYRRAIGHTGQREIWLDTGTLQEDQQWQAGRDAGERLFSEYSNVDAVQAYSDIMALGLISAAHDRGVVIPRDLAIIGFDNRRMTQFCHPRLSTVAQPNEGAGTVAAEMLLKQIRAPATEVESQTLKTTVVERDSV